MIGVEALRYFLLREVVFGPDGSFSYDALVGRYNSDLANGLGNLASRTLTMIKQYRDGVVPAAAPGARSRVGHRGGPRLLRPARILEGPRSRLVDALRGGQLHRGAGAVETGARTPTAAAALDATLYTAAEVLRVATALLHPVLPESTAKIWAQLGMTRAARGAAASTSLPGASLPPDRRSARSARCFRASKPSRR